MEKMTVEFQVPDPDEKGEFLSVRVAEKKVSPDLVGADDIIDDRDSIMIWFAYPLERPFPLTLVEPGGITRRRFAQAVLDQYRDIYREESRSIIRAKKLAEKRGTTDPIKGKYGIWGHFREELYLEAAWRDEKDHWRLLIGS